MPDHFSSPLPCAPCADPAACCATCCCPCCTFGEVISTIKESGMHGCFMILPILNCMEICCVLPSARQEMRDTFNLEVGLCPNDCLTSACCAFCAIVQLKTELKKRGLYGESALMKYNQQKGTQMTAPPPQDMK